MRRIIYYLGIGCFMAILCYNVATSLSNPFYGMSEAALAFTSSGNGYNFDCSGSCADNCNNWKISYTLDCQGFFSSYDVKYFDSLGNVVKEYDEGDDPWLIGEHPSEIGCQSEQCV